MGAKLTLQLPLTALQVGIACAGDPPYLGLNLADLEPPEDPSNRLEPISHHSTKAIPTPIAVSYVRWSCFCYVPPCIYIPILGMFLS